jgi:glyoxylase-like metal-dependent hydrolase (beta-lactamase superfamily II)
MTTTAQVGRVSIAALLDVDEWHLPRPFPGVPPDLWEEYRALYPEALCDGDAVCIPATSYLLRAGGRTILVDTGIGPGPVTRAGLDGRSGRLPEALREAGVRPDEIDTVVITHLHFDHVGWNARLVDGQSVPTFPRARYLVPEKDWAYFRRPELAERARHLPPTWALGEQGAIDLVDGEHAITPEVHLLPTPGHTPGHQAVMVVSGGQRATILGDVAHTPAQVQETHWSSVGDVDPEASARTRARLLDDAEAHGTLLCAGHFPHPGFGYLVRLAGRRLFKGL